MALLFHSIAFANSNCTYTVDESLKGNYYGSHPKVVATLNQKVFEAVSKKGYRLCLPKKQACDGANHLTLTGGYASVKSVDHSNHFGYTLNLQEGSEPMWIQSGDGKVANENFKGQSFTGASKETLVPISINLEEVAGARLLVDIKDHLKSCTP